MMDFLQSLDWSPLIISLKTGVVATVISFFLGLLAARWVVRLSYRVKAVVDGILTLPMVLPPTVAGFILLLIFSRRRPIGIFLDQQFGHSGGPHMAGMYPCSYSHRFSPDVPQRPGSF